MEFMLRLRWAIGFSVMASAMASGTAWAGLPVRLDLYPTGDSFVREQAPSLNYGGAGLLCVGGSASLNGGGQANGRFDSVLQFDASEARSLFDSAYEPGRWVISRIELHLFENGVPGNSLFPRGVGQFSVSWMSGDDWIQGNGSPAIPLPGSGIVITWSLLQSLLASGTEVPLGAFSSTGDDGPVICSLPFDVTLEAEIATGSLLTLHFAPVTPTIGFSFHSTNYFENGKRPTLSLEAVPRGDADCNGLVNVNDIGPFVTGLLAGELPGGCRTAVVDMNQDGMLDGRDVQAFVAWLGVF